MSRQSIQLVGFVLWRGGMLFVVAVALFEIARRALKFINIPAQLEIGFGLAIGGFGLVIISLILERMQDAKLEGDLQE